MDRLTLRQFDGRAEGDSEGQDSRGLRLGNHQCWDSVLLSPAQSKSRRPTNVLAVEKESPSELEIFKEPEAFEDVEALR